MTTYEEAREKLVRFAALDPGWDGHGATTIYEDCLARSRSLLRLCEALGLPAPQVAPTSAGGVQVEWSLDGVGVELEVRPDGSYEWLVDRSGEMVEGEI